MIKLTQLLQESTEGELKQIANGVKKKHGDIKFSIRDSKHKAGPRSYEKIHPTLIISKEMGSKGNDILATVTIGGNYEAEYGWVVSTNMQLKSFKSHDLKGIVQHIIKTI